MILCELCGESIERSKFAEHVEQQDEVHNVTGF